MPQEEINDKINPKIVKDLISVIIKTEDIISLLDAIGLKVEGEISDQPAGEDGGKQPVRQEGGRKRAGRKQAVERLQRYDRGQQRHQQVNQAREREPPDHPEHAGPRPVERLQQGKMKHMGSQA